MKIDRHRTYHQIADAEMQWRMQVDKDVHEVNPNPYLSRKSIFRLDKQGD